MSLSGKYSNQLTIIIILLIGIGARTYFARELHPNSDEYVSMLASQAVQSSGLPVLPSGLFYTNGFLFSWIGTGKQLQDLLKQSDQVWFVVSESVYDNYFRGDWHFVEQQNMKLVWQDDAALVYRSRDPGILLPNQPDHIVDANLSNLVQLRGYSSALAGPAYRVFLFWNVLSPLPDNFTQFVHIRNEKGETVAQADFQPLEGQYPTTRWKKGETVVDVVDIPVPANLSPGKYQIMAGLYRWDTLERIPIVDDASGENAVWLETVTIQ